MKNTNVVKCFKSIITLLALSLAATSSAHARSFLTDKSQYHTKSSAQSGEISELKNLTQNKEIRTVMQNFKNKYPEHFQSIESRLKPIAELCIAADQIEQNGSEKQRPESMITARYMTIEELRTHKSRMAQKNAIENTLRKDVYAISLKIKIQTHWYFSLSGMTFRKQLTDLGIQDPKRIKNLILQSINELQNSSTGQRRNYQNCARIVHTFLGQEFAI